jgi:cob(I)alamin adenosyltransferase
LKKGLLIVNTGESGRTSLTALGTSLRAIGRGFRVCVIRFLESRPTYEESDLCGLFGGRLVIREFDRAGNEWPQSGAKGAADAPNARHVVEGAIHSRDYDLVVLDGLHHLIDSGIVTERQVLDITENRPEALHLIVTGNFKPKSLVEAAEVVTDICEVKNPPSPVKQEGRRVGLQ